MGEQESIFRFRVIANPYLHPGEWMVVSTMPKTGTHEPVFSELTLMPDELEYLSDSPRCQDCQHLDVLHSQDELYCHIPECPCERVRV